jgi:NHL repeat
MRLSANISASGGGIALLVMVLLTFALPSTASADKVISEAGSGAGQVLNPQELAVDFETGRLYVADQGNNRIAVFDKDGNFEMAFGWGVNDGKAELQTCTIATTCRKGLSGSGKGQFRGPTGIAVDNDPASPSWHDVYVVDYDNRRVEKFTADGEFLLMFGGGVNKTTSGDICTAASGDTCGAGSNGFGEGEGSKFSGAAIRVGVGPLGVVYVADSKFKNGEHEGEGFGSRIQRFEPSGAFIDQHSLGMGKMAEIAVDSAGFVYVHTEHTGGGFRKYDSNFAEVFDFEFVSDNPRALSVDPSDHIFAAEGTQGIRLNIAEYDSSTPPNQVRRFGYGSIQSGPKGLAPYQSPSGDIYASESNRVIHLSFPPPGPLVLPQPCKAAPLGNIKATLNAEVNPEGKATTVHFEYIKDADYVANGTSFTGTKPATSTPESEPVGSDFDLHPASAQAAPLVPETKYHCRIVATNADAPGGVTGSEGAFTTLEPLEIGATWASDVGTEAARLNATVNPLGIETTGYFEYVSEATYQKDIAELGSEHGFDHASKAPAGEEIDFGAGESFQAGSATISGLAPDTAYRYRILATDTPLAAEGKEVKGPTKALRTYRPGEVRLPDSRAYELVSPVLKNNAEVAVPGFAGGLFDETSVRIQASSDSGEAITYTSWTSFGGGESAPSTSQYLSKRGATGWGTENISPLGFLKNPVRPPYRGFSPDLSLGAFVTSEPPLTADCQGIENLYLRDNANGEIQCLTDQPAVKDPTELSPACTAYAGASADGKRAFFVANMQLTPDAPAGQGFHLYEWSEAEGLRLASLLPGETPAAPSPDTAFGAKGSGCGMGEKRPAVSSDGSVAFWTYAPKPGTNKLMARVNGQETIQLDLKQAGAPGPSGGGIYQAASKDGSAAFFTADSRLTPGAGPGDLYRYEVGAEEKPLTDLTPESLTPGAEAAKVQGVVGASEDGSYLYFVAGGILSEAENDAGQKAIAGKPNLYLWHEGEGVRFIATLSGGDSLDWSPLPRSQSARVSADGRHLAFLSIATEELWGYDNTIAEGDGCQPTPLVNELGTPIECPQAFLYGADADELICASCNPTGARPQGPTELPAWSNPYEGPRYLSEDGSRLFFESRDVLSPQDESQKRDVYEFEREGKGTCTSESPAFNPLSGGCVFLISSGKSSRESYLLDASSDGRDVFFSTRRSLVGWDLNDNYDVYDARVGGGFPEPTEPPLCEGEACKPPPVQPPPSGSSSATATFDGPGNASQKRPRCAKGKVRRKARCVKPRNQRKHKRQRQRAHGNGRTAR